jgi:hypothetical protein
MKDILKSLASSNPLANKDDLHALYMDAKNQGVNINSQSIRNQISSNRLFSDIDQVSPNTPI